MKHLASATAIVTVACAAAGVTSARADEAPARYGRAVIARPLTLPGSVFQVGADAAANNDFSLLTARLIGGYGIDDKLEVTTYYAFLLKEFEAEGDLDVNVGYAVMRGAVGGKLEVIARAQAGYSVLGDALRPLALGAHAQFNLTDTIAVITPGQQLSIAIDGDPKPVTFGLPVALGFQATPELYLQLDTSVGTINIADSESTFIFADTTPVTITAVFNAMPALDVLVGGGLNVTPAEPAGVGDTLQFLVGVRYYGGQL